MNKVVKLSDVQKFVIIDMRAGKKLHMMGGFNNRCFFGTGKNISWATISKLETAGLIERFDMEKKIELTPLGKNIKL